MTDDMKPTSKTAERADIIADLRDEYYRGPMQHLRCWSDLDVMHERAAREIESLRHHVKISESQAVVTRAMLEAAHRAELEGSISRPM